MKIFNKIIWSKKEPTNKNDIWFDGKVSRIYKEGNWIPMNAIEVKQNGGVYIEVIGGFTGENSDTSKSVQEVINELVNKLNEITTND